MLSKLWEPVEDYKRFNPQSLEDLEEANLYPEHSLPYKRLYENLTPWELRELLADAKRLRWKALDLSHCGLNSLPDELWELEDLRVLVLGNVYTTRAGDRNTFATVPLGIGQLTNLQSLDLHNTPIRELPDSIGQLTNLQSLDLSYTQIRALPDSIGQLKNLKKLNLAGCHLQEIPYSIVKLGLPFVTNIEFAENCINLSRVTLDEGDISLFEQPRDVIEAYYKGKQSQIRECKVIFLGDGAVGKTSLIERIVHDTFNPDAMPTEGIDVIKWFMSVQTTQWETTVDDAPFTVRFLDFGGQEIMHSAHRCFLTGHTVYVVVCASRDDTEIDSIAARWLESVRDFAPGCPVILALNKADLNPNVSVNERDLQARNPALKGVLKTSAKAKKADSKFGVNRLITAIQNEIPDAVSAYRMNADMLEVKQELEDMGDPYISSKRYQEICASHHITDSDLQYNLLGYFRDLGVAYYYESESVDTRLESVRVLNPEWLTNGIYRLILRTEESGFLRHKEIKKTLRASYAGDIHQEITYTPEETEYILHVMRYFEISLSIRDRQGREKGVEMIPLKLPKTQPQVQEDGGGASFADEFPKADALHLRWEGTYLPNNLIHRLLIRKFPELDTRRVWRTGGRFHQRGGDCEAMAEMDDNALDVYVIGEQDRRPYLDTFRVEILDILQKLNLTPTELICCTADGKTGYIPYEDVLQQYKDGIEKMYIPVIKQYRHPAELLGETYVSWEKQAERDLKRAEMEQIQSETEKNRSEAELNRTEAEKNRTEAEKNNTESEKNRTETERNRLLLTGGVTLALAYGAYLLIQAIFQPGTPLEFNPFEFLAQLLSG